MNEIIKRFEQQCPNGGLCIIGTPTGFGKTYNAGKYIAEHFDDGGVFFYITHLKKNINGAIKECRKHFVETYGENKGAELFDSSYLFIHANADAVVDNFPKNGDLPYPEIIKWESYRKLRDSIQYLQRNKDHIEKRKKREISNDDPAIALIFSTIRDSYEPAFRKDLERFVTSLSKKSQERYQIICSDYPILLDLYPSIKTKQKRIFFMSIDKFYLGNSTIIEPSYRFYSNEITKGALIFIDEFDSSKSAILAQMIQESSKNRADIYDLFNQINKTLNTNVIPKRLYDMSPSQDSKKGIRYVLDSIKEVFSKTSSQFNLSRFFKYDGDWEKENSFLFEDSHLISIDKNSKNIDLLVKPDTGNTTNMIYSSESSNKPDGAEKIYPVIQSMRGAVRYFVKGIAIIANDYMRGVNSRKKSTDEKMEIDAAVSSVLNIFGFGDNHRRLLTSLIINNSSLYHSTKGSNNSLLLADFYSTGFRYYTLSDDKYSDLTTRIDTLFLDATPESFMLVLANRAKIVGLSATGNILSATGNYDLEYLKPQLGDKYYQLSAREISTLKLMQKLREYYNNAEVIVKRINAESDNLLDEINLSEGKKQEWLEIISSLADSPYYQNNFAKIAKAISDFVIQPKTKILLVLTNGLPDESKLYSKTNVERLISDVADYSKAQSKVKVVLLRSPTFDDDIATFREEAWKRDQKVIVLSTYNSVGTGQNITYATRRRKGEPVEKEIDCLYIEYPTNSVVNINDKERGLSEDDLIRFIYQVECLCQCGDISESSMRKIIKGAFARYLRGRAFPELGPVYNSQSVNNNQLKTLIQAVGRMSRGKKKKGQERIYVDQLIYKIKFASLKDIPLSKEFICVKDEIISTQATQIEDDGMKKIINQGVRNNNVVVDNINTVLSNNRNEWSEPNMMEWENIRDFVMRHITISEEELGNFPPSYRSFYLKAPQDKKISRYWVSGREMDDSNNFDKIKDISYEEKDGFISINTDALLQLLMRLDNLEHYFNKNHYMTRIVPNDYILTPVMMRNIYYGALGETVGSFVFETSGINIERITDPKRFEKFDFVVSEKPNIYIDFKFWSIKSAEGLTKGIERDQVYTKALEKLKAIDGKKAIFVNVFLDALAKPHVTANGKVIIVPSILKYAKNRTLEIDQISINYIKEKILEEVNDNESND